MKAAVCLALLLTVPLHSETRRLTILHTSDLHARLLPDNSQRGGFAYVATALREQRAGCSHCIHLDAGDMVMGTPVSTLFRGVPIYEIANTLGLDAFTLGNHDFDYGWQQIAAFRKKASFPIATANVFGPDGKPLADSRFIILRVNGLRVGVIGAVMSNLVYGYLSRKTAGPIRVEPVLETVRAVARQIAPVTDVIAVLGHITPAEGSAILREVPEVHVVVEGHSHRGLEEMDRVDGRVRVGVRGYGVEIGRLDLEVDTAARTLRSASWTKVLVDASRLKPATDVDRLVQRWERRASAVVDKPVAEARRDFEPREVLDLIEQAMREELGASFAYMNRGGVRDRLAKGVVRERDIWNIMPFDNEMMVARVKGSQVPDPLRRGAAVDPDKEYVLAVHDFNFENEALRKESGIEGIDFKPTNRQLRDLLIEWVRKKKVLQ